MNIHVLAFSSSKCVSIPLHLVPFLIVGILTISGVLETLCDACAVLVRQHVPEIVRQAINGYVQVKTPTVVFDSLGTGAHNWPNSRLEGILQ